MENPCECSETYHATECPVTEPGKPASINAAIAESAAALQEIYEKRTAGDFTFIGVLADFYFIVKDMEKE